MEPALVPYVSLVEFLGKVLGEDAEVVLHDVTDVNASIVAIQNGHISGRQVGFPATDLALQVLAGGVGHQLDFLANYRSESVSGKGLDSSTYFVKNSSGDILGMLCINLDRSRYQDLRAALDRIIGDSGAGTPKAAVTERLGHSVDSLAMESLNREMARYSIEVGRMSAPEKKEIVRNLERSGLFLLKGGVTLVAQRLEVSEATLYRYLHEVRNDGNEG